MKILKLIIDELASILLKNIKIFNNISLSNSYDEYKNKQDFSNLYILEAGNEEYLEQWCFKNRKSKENKCKRLRPYDIHPNNISLIEYKKQVEGGITTKCDELLYQTLHNLLYETECKIGKSFKLTSKIAQDELFTNTITEYLEYLDKEDELELLNEITKLLNNGFNEFIKILIFNHSIIKDFYNDILSSYEIYINKIIERLDNIPEIEQKTEAWFKLRDDMISASICGYMDGYVSGIGISKEHEKIKEKSNITPKKHFSMGCGPLKHGILFEDVSSQIYDSLNGLISKEYGILPDYRHNEIGASPDGIIVGLDTLNNENSNSNILQKCKYGRMREIKNPTSRSITTGKIPNYYYYQMQQQMYVCDLPYCDFIQTSIEYPETDLELDEYRLRNFILDTFDKDNINKISTFYDLNKYFPKYIINKINWWKGLHLSSLYENILNTDFNNVEYLLIRNLILNWNLYCSIPLCNLTKNGKIKGIFWYYTKGEKENLEYKYTWTNINKEITPESIGDITDNYLIKWVEEGYTLNDKYYFIVSIYDEKEIEYNQCMYEDALSRLIKKWEYILYLRQILDVEKRLEAFNSRYILSNKNNKSITFNSMKNLDNDYSMVDNDNSNNSNNSNNTIENILGINVSEKKIKKIKKKNNKKNTINELGYTNLLNKKSKSNNLNLVNAYGNDDDDIFNLD